MNSPIAKIVPCLEKDILFFEKKYASVFNGKGSIKLLTQVKEYTAKQKGKRVRPILVLLSARLNGSPKDTTFVFATVLELLHQASLLHDDVLDEADKRRNFPTVRKMWGNEVSILFGNYLLIKGYKMITKKGNNVDLVKVLTKTITRMIEGEFIQMENSINLSLSKAQYFKTIEAKTSVLITTCCKLGYLSTLNSHNDQTKLVSNIGKNLGMAFQIKDDLFDYSLNSNFEKPVGADIREKKITLPLLHALENATRVEEKYFKQLLNHKELTDDHVKELINFSIKKKGIDETKKVMETYRNKAIKLLRKLPESEGRTGLEKLAFFITEREA